jgi:DNA-directed RNA polymerase specialized sigma24 family protein
MFLAKTSDLNFSASTVEAEASALPASKSAIAELTVRLMNGEEDAYGEFYDLYSHRLFAYLFTLSSGKEDLARELLQQTLIKAARHIREFDDEESLWSWLATVARHCSIDEARKQNRYQGLLERFRNCFSQPAPPATAPALDYVELLPPEDRALLEKKYLEGLSVAEIAESLGVSDKAIESRLTRARIKLKELISASKKP